MIEGPIFIGAFIFFILSGALSFKNKIREEVDNYRNIKMNKWNASAIKANKGDLSEFYRISKE